MSDEPIEEQSPSVFGNLPASRPGTRSPRRAPEATARSAGAGEPDPPTRADEVEPEPPRSRAAEPEPPDQDADAAGGLEDLAWAGLATAAEAATLGVRLATRALEALRDASPRR